jgi:hypothetical protein
VRDTPTQAQRRAAAKKIVFPFAALTVWSLPVVQTVVLPAHAQTSQPVVCTREDVLGRWQMELFGVAASTAEMVFHDDGKVDHTVINAWQFVDGQLQMTQGTTWIMMGEFGASCDIMTGTYLNLFTLPLFGNVIIRNGDWRARKL